MLDVGKHMLYKYPQSTSDCTTLFFFLDGMRLITSSLFIYPPSPRRRGGEGRGQQTKKNCNADVQLSGQIHFLGGVGRVVVPSCNFPNFFLEEKKKTLMEEQYWRSTLLEFLPLVAPPETVDLLSALRRWIKKKVIFFCHRPIFDDDERSLSFPYKEIEKKSFIVRALSYVLK